MATKKRPSKRLELDVMTNREVLSELARIYGDLLYRLNSYAAVLDADHVDDDDLETSAPTDTFDDVYDQAMGLLSRFEELERWFKFGSGRLPDRDGGYWNWGTTTYKQNFCERAAAGLAVAS